MLNLYLIRHGQSEVNARPDEIGQSPFVKLTELGRLQSEKLSIRLKQDGILFNQIYSSPYTRAIDTARIACIDQPSNIIEVAELREYSAGDWTGQSRSQTVTNNIKLKMAYLGNAFLFPNGESLSMVERRVSSWLEEHVISNLGSDFSQKLHIGIFSHGMTIKCLLHHIMGFDQLFTWRISLDNTSITKLSFDKDGWKVLNINDCAHLR